MIKMANSHESICSNDKALIGWIVAPSLYMDNQIKKMMQQI
jgi:hypothetical protein